jgi:HEAT repeat protein
MNSSEDFDAESVLESLRSGCPSTRSEAAEEICLAASYGMLRDVGTFVPVLIEALHDPEHSVRGCAAAALGHIGITGEAKSALPRLNESLNDPDPRVRDVVARVIADLESC